MPPSPIRQFRSLDYDARSLVGCKGDQRISVCLPARNEEQTVGQIVEAIRARTMDEVALVDEVLVIDDHSTDRTADVAIAAGAKVIDAAEVLPEYGEGHGKGEALWKSLFVSTGDIVVWCDSDIRDFDASFVTGLLGPLLEHDDVDFVKGFYERPVEGASLGGGRVTELVARPALTLLYPELAGIVQPLAGEYAGRRSVLERVPFVEGYGVDIALLIDVTTLVGIDRVVQVDLGVRVHRNRTLAELSPQALAVMETVLSRAAPGLVERGADRESDDVAERPPLTEVQRRAGPPPP